MMDQQLAIILITVAVLWLALGTLFGVGLCRSAGRKRPVR